MMHCSPSLQLELTVIKCLIVASWEFVLNISSSVMIIWVWVGGGCNHLGWRFDEILGLVFVPRCCFKCPFRVFTLHKVHQILLITGFLKGWQCVCCLLEGRG